MGRTEKTNPNSKPQVEMKKGKKSQGNSSKPKLTSRNAARERSRVRSLRSAFQALQDSLPAIPRHTKLSKLDVLVLAASYIAHLSHALDPTPESPQCLPAHLHPVRKWPMRSRLYAGVCSNMSECPLDTIDSISQADEFTYDITADVTNNDALDWQLDESLMLDSSFTYL